MASNDPNETPNRTLDNRTALIVGGGTGIGLGIAQAFASAGCRVAIAGRRAEVLEKAASDWSAPSPPQTHTVDVADRESVARLVHWANESLGRIDILVNAAGINIRTRSMAEMTPEQWDQVLAINASGAYNLMHAVLPAMRTRKGGLIINISSISGKRALALGGVAYCASKFAMSALGTCAGNEEAAHGIRVTNVYPGEVNTPILDHRPNPVSEEHRARILQPEDVGQVCLAIAQLPPRAHVPEIVIKPTSQEYV